MVFLDLYSTKDVSPKFYSAKDVFPNLYSAKDFFPDLNSAVDLLFKRSICNFCYNCFGSRMVSVDQRAISTPGGSCLHQENVVEIRINLVSQSSLNM